MRVTLEYHGPARTLAGLKSEAADVSEGTSVADLLVQASVRHAPLGPLLLAEGQPSRTLLLAVNDHQVDEPARYVLNDGDVLSIIPPVSGGCE